MRIKIPENLIINFLKTNFEVKETSTGELRINSPFAQDRKFHLYIEPKRGVFNDFKSGMAGSFTKFVSDFLDIPETQVLATLIKEYGVRSIGETFSYQEEIKKKAELELPNNITFFGEIYAETKKLGPVGEQALRYLTERKVPQENILEMGYIYDPNDDYNKRIFIPFFEDGELVYFVARDFTGKTELRYKNPPNLDTKDFVYNIDKFEDTIVICEGVFDALSVTEPVATAMMSAHLGKNQAIKIMNRAPEKIIFVPDNDETGARTLERNIELLNFYKPASVHTKFYIFNVPEGKDLNEYKCLTGKDKINIEDCYEHKKEIKIYPVASSNRWKV